MEEKRADEETTIEKYRINKKLFTFLVCLALSAFFWVLMTFSKEYTVAVSFPVKYMRMPMDKVVANNLPKTIELDLRTSGFRLLAIKFAPENQTIEMDVKNARLYSQNNSYYLLTNNSLEKINRQFSNNVKILRASPDTIYFNFNKKITRTIPVKKNIKLTFDKQYQLSDSIKLTPSRITISGAADVVKKIREIETVPVVFNDIKKSFTFKLAIVQSPILKQVELNTNQIEAEIKVIKFTEASLELPIEVINLPAGITLKTFPEKMEVKYLVAFNDYEKINTSNFRLVVDYEKIDKRNKKVKLNLIKSPDNVRVVRLSSERVEYIIRK